MIYLYLILVFFSGSCLAEDAMRIQLRTQVELLPVYISPLQDEENSFSAQYQKQLIDVLVFDFAHNGMTQVVDSTKKRKQLDQATPFDFQGDVSPWAKESIYYVIKTKVKNKKLDVRILEVNANNIKSLESITLTGNLSQDRRTIHQVSDSIFKALFGKDGIASTKFLYSVKAQNPATKKWTSVIYEADYDGANARPVTDKEGFAITPVYVPPKAGYKSQSFLFVSYKNGQPKIYFGNLQDGQIGRFSLLKGNQLLPTVSWQRDKIAFISDVTGNPDLFLQRFDTENGLVGKPRQIFMSHKATQGGPSFSPNGKQIAFVSNKDGSPRIYVIDIPKETDDVRLIKAKLITKLNRESTAPAWSPDGSKIAYCAQKNGARQIWLYDFATNSEKALTDGAKNKENPTWAPNSLHLIFNTSDADDCELYLINLNQTETVKISSGPGEKHFPAWELMGGLQ